VLLQDPDLEDAKFLILDFSAPEPKKPRELSVIDARDIPRVTEERKVEMLSVFAEGFLLAREELSHAKKAESEGKQREEGSEKDQPGLFDPKP
jgi:hypothetical protein